MHNFVGERDLSQIPHELPQEFVVVARRVEDLSPAIQQFQNPPDDGGVGVRPVPRASQSPTINDVAHQIQPVGLHVVEKVEQLLGTGITTTKMRVAEKDCSDSSRSHTACRGAINHSLLAAISVEGCVPFSTTRKQVRSSDSTRGTSTSRLAANHGVLRSHLQQLHDAGNLVRANEDIAKSSLNFW